VAQTADYRNRLGIAYALRKDHTRAEAVFRRLLDDEPQNAIARQNLTRTLRAAGRPGEADVVAQPAALQ
jgi:Flp pilus assembly protein TadD